MREAVALLERAVTLEPDPGAQREIWQEIAHANALYFDGKAFAAAMAEAIALADGDRAHADLYAELAFQTMSRAGMWGTAPPSDLVQGWIDRALELAAPDTAARAKALIARCYADYDKSADDAAEASAIAERLGDPALRSRGYDVRHLVAFVQGDYREALEWCRRRESFVDELHDADAAVNVYASAINPAVACGEGEEARRYAALHDEATRALSPHHRLHGSVFLLLLEELFASWEQVLELRELIETRVEESAATPCVLGARSLYLCALANAYLGNDDEAKRLEAQAEPLAMSGYGTVLDTPRLLLAIHRGDLMAVESLLGEPAVRSSNWFYLAAMAAHLDGLAALGERERVEREAVSRAPARDVSGAVCAPRAWARTRRRSARRAGGGALRGFRPRVARRPHESSALVVPVVRQELDVFDAGLRRRHRHENGVLLPGGAERPRGLRRNSDRAPRLEVDDLSVELPLRAARDEEVHLFLNRMPVASPMRMPFRRPPAAAEALVRDGEVLQTERLAHEADLEVVWIHTDRGRQVRNIGYSNDCVVGHGPPFGPGESGVAHRHDSGTPRAAWCLDLDRLAHGSSEQGASERRVGRDAPVSLDAGDLDFHVPAVVAVDLDDRADADFTLVQPRRVDEHRVVEARAQRPDAGLEQPLLVLGGVVLEVLRQVAVLTRGLDRLHHGRTLRAFELGELVGERLVLRRRQLVVSRLAHRRRSIGRIPHASGPRSPATIREMLPDYWIERPPLSLDAETQAAVEAFLSALESAGSDRTLDVEGLLRDYGDVAPWKFLCGVADRRRFAFHGTGDPDIESFEPRHPIDFAPFGDQKAVFATSDPIWAMFYAIVDRDSHDITLNNGCIVVLDANGDPGTPHYYFSISRGTLPLRPWRTGYVYLLPIEGFVEQAAGPYGGQVARVPQLASPAPVRPLARMQVSPGDFPFLAQIRGHDDERLAEYAQAVMAAAPWPE